MDAGGRTAEMGVRVRTVGMAAMGSMVAEELMGRMDGTGAMAAMDSMVGTELMEEMDAMG